MRGPDENRKSPAAKVGVALYVLLAPFGCSGPTAIDVGSNDAGAPPAVGPGDTEACRNGTQLPIVGRWDGYIENFALASGSDSIHVTVTSATAAEACGNVALGTKTPPGPATDPDAVYPPDYKLSAGRPDVTIDMTEGFPMTMREGAATSARLTFLANWREFWRSWCLLQKPILTGRDSETGESSYSCLTREVVTENDRCYFLDDAGDQHFFDCKKQYLCLPACECTTPCQCDETSCDARPGADLAFDLHVTGDEASGSVKINGTSSGPSNVLLTRAAKNGTP